MLGCRKVRMIVVHTFQAASQQTDAGHKYLKLVAAHNYYSSPEQVLKLEQIQTMYLMVGCWKHDHLGYSNHSRLAVGKQL